jgi:hypothetical protein
LLIASWEWLSTSLSRYVSCVSTLHVSLARE